MSATTSSSRADRPLWSIVRHYLVLFSADSDKKETNRVWHDGRLSHHTYNGRLILYDEADVELVQGFASPTKTKTAGAGADADSGIFPDGTELTMDDYVVQVQSFERVSRTDVAPILNANEAAKAKKKQEQAQFLRAGEAVDGARATNTRTSAPSMSASASTSTSPRHATTPRRSPPRPPRNGSVTRVVQSAGRFLDSGSSSGGEDDGGGAGSGSGLTTPRQVAAARSPATADRAPPLPAFRTPFKRPREAQSPLIPTHVTGDAADAGDESPGRPSPVKKRLGSARLSAGLSKRSAGGKET